MAPSLRDGDLVLLRRDTPPRIGRIVAYRHPIAGSLLLHRVVGTEAAKLVVAGDGNSWIDATCLGRDVTGVVWRRTPRLGGVGNERWRQRTPSGASAQRAGEVT